MPQALTGFGQGCGGLNQVAFAQRLLQRRVQLGGGHVAVVQVTLDEVAIDLDDLLDQRPMRRGADASLASISTTLHRPARCCCNCHAISKAMVPPAHMPPR